MQYRVVLPLKVALRRKLQVVYLLHSGGGGFRDWPNDSDVARFAESGFALVMPEGGASYHTMPPIRRRIATKTKSCRI
jgi:hypothetical protein